MSGNTRTQDGVGVYVRKSSDKQSDLSLPAQERIIRQRILEPAGVTKYKLYPDILSGKRPDRTGYQQMLADARAGKLRMVVFHKVNRFGRNAAEGLMAIEELRKLGVEIRIADLPTLDIRTPEGMFIFTFLLGQGQYEVENLGSEARKGMQEKFARGDWPFHAPDGYKNCREEISPRKFRAWIEVDRHRAAIIRLLYRWYSVGNTTLLALAHRLNKLHDQRIAAGKSGCLRESGKRWGFQAIYHVLNNRFYLGEMEVAAWGPARQGNHRPIVSLALFERVQVVLAQHSHAPLQRHVYLLQGLVWLDGAIMMRCTTLFQRGRLYTYYFRYTESGRRVYLDAQRIENQVVRRIRRLVNTLGDAPAAMLRQRIATHVVALRQHARNRMDDMAVERQRTLHLARKGRFTEAEIAAELNRLETEQAWAERELTYAQQIETMHESLLAEASSDVVALTRWSELSIEEQHQLVSRMIQQVEIDAAGTVTRIVWHLLWDLLWFAPKGPTHA